MNGIIKHDIYAGIIRMWTKFAMYGVIILFGGIMALSNRNACNIEDLSAQGMMLFNFVGCTPMSDGLSQVTPMMWVVIQSYIAYIIATYPLEDMRVYGINMMVRSKSRTKWWIGKVIWAIITVLTAYVVGNFVLMIFAKLLGGSVLIESTDISRILNVNIELYTNKQMILIQFVLPIIASITVTLLELVVMFVTNEIIAIMLVMLLVVGSIFFDNPIWILNKTMIIRNGTMINSNEIYVFIIAMLIISIVCVIIGCAVIRKKNIFGR